MSITGFQAQFYNSILSKYYDLGINTPFKSPLLPQTPIQISIGFSTSALLTGFRSNYEFILCNPDDLTNPLLIFPPCECSDPSTIPNIIPKSEKCIGPYIIQSPFLFGAIPDDVGKNYQITLRNKEGGSNEMTIAADGTNSAHVVLKTYSPQIQYIRLNTQNNKIQINISINLNTEDEIYGIPYRIIFTPVNNSHKTPQPISGNDFFGDVTNAQGQLMFELNVDYESYNYIIMINEKQSRVGNNTSYTDGNQLFIDS